MIAFSSLAKPLQVIEFPLRKRGGFTLIEVAFATGIVAFALVGLIGLASGLMQQGGESAHQTALVNIARTLEGQYREITSDMETHRQNQTIYRYSLNGRFIGTGEIEPGDGSAYFATVADATPADLSPAYRVTLITLKSRFESSTRQGRRFLVSGRVL